MIFHSDYFTTQGDRHASHEVFYRHPRPGQRKFSQGLTPEQFDSFYAQYEAACYAEDVVPLRVHVGYGEGRAFCITSAPVCDLSPAGKEQRKRNVLHKRIERSTAVIHKGQPVSGAYLVTEGGLRVYTHTPQGTEATLYFIRAAETCILALNCLFNDLRYPVWVETTADTLVEIIPGAFYRELFEKEHVVQDLTVKALSTRVFRLMEELEQIHACNLDQRLANFLLSNATEDGVLLATQQTLAGHLGTTREVIARLMQGFVVNGYIETGRGRVMIKDAKGLAKLMEFG